MADTWSITRSRRYAANRLGRRPRNGASRSGLPLVLALMLVGNVERSGEACCTGAIAHSVFDKKANFFRLHSVRNSVKRRRGFGRGRRDYGAAERGDLKLPNAVSVGNRRRSRLLCCASSLPVVAPPALTPAAQAQTVARILVEGNQRIEPETVLSYMQIRPGDAFDRREDRRIGQGAVPDRPVLRCADLPARQRPGRCRRGKSADQSGQLRGQQRDQGQGPREGSRAQGAHRSSRARRCRATCSASSRSIAGRASIPRGSSPRSSACRRTASISSSRSTRAPKRRSGASISSATKHSATAICARSSPPPNTAGGSSSSTADSYDPDRLNYDKELLRRYYLKNGFADFQIISADAELAPDGESFSSPSPSRKARSTSSAASR